MRSPVASSQLARVALIAVLAAALTGCAVGLVDGASRASGFSGATNVSRAQAGSRDDVPVRGHRVRVTRRSGSTVMGELIAAGDDDMLIERAPGDAIRIPLEDVKSVSIKVAPSHAGATALIAIGAMVAGIAGLATVDSDSSVSAFFGGWGIAWIPLGLFVALPSAIGIAVAGDGELQTGRSPSIQAMRQTLHEFARYPQGEPARSSTLPLPAAPPRPPPAKPATVPPPAPAAPPPATPPPAAQPPIETFPSVAPPAAPSPTAPPKPKAKPAPAPPPAPEEPPDEPTVTPYAPERTPAPPQRQ
jgi:hypothetical protein